MRLDLALALFINIDAAAQEFYETPKDLLFIIGALMALAVLGFVLSALTEKAIVKKQGS